MTARWITADVFDGLATLETGSVDLVVTSPPFLALRSYLPADHPDKGKEIGSEATPAEFIDVMLKVTAELRRVLAPHGSICVELGDTYAGSGGGGGDYYEGGLREGQPGFTGSSEASREALREANAAHWRQKNRAKDRPQDDVDERGRKYQKVTYEGYASGIRNMNNKTQGGGTGWPLAKSRTLIPQLYEIALAYGINPLTGRPSPAGQWRIRNVVTWARPNPPVGALGDKWRPATSDLIVACVSPKRYWDDLATRKPHVVDPATRPTQRRTERSDIRELLGAPSGEAFSNEGNPSGAPLLDYWEIPPGGYKGSHYAVFPEELVVPCVKAMCPEKVCRVCGEPSRRITEPVNGRPHVGEWLDRNQRRENYDETNRWKQETGDTSSRFETLGWTDCGHRITCPTCNGTGEGRWLHDAIGREPCPDCVDGQIPNYRPGLVLDPFAGSGTTLSVATGHGHDAIGIDLDPRNADLARDRIGPFLFEETRMQ